MFLGIDVSKATLDVALIKDENKPRHKVFANTTAGHQQFLSWLKDKGAVSVHACLEATGTFAEPVTLALADAGHRVSLVNPAQIYHFAQTSLSRTKTDKADASKEHRKILPDAPATDLDTTRAPDPYASSAGAPA